MTSLDDFELCSEIEDLFNESRTFHRWINCLEHFKGLFLELKEYNYYDNELLSYYELITTIDYVDEKIVLDLESRNYELENILKTEKHKYSKVHYGLKCIKNYVTQHV
jgi:hypothetical protein